jgi:hypothetical protein
MFDTMMSRMKVTEIGVTAMLKPFRDGRIQPVRINLLISFQRSFRSSQLLKTTIGRFQGYAKVVSLHDLSVTVPGVADSRIEGS